jgi:tetratricopeptide (TPR) repeat protein
MSDPRPKELIHADQLVNEGKINEALEIIETFENRGDLTPGDQLWTLLLRGWISVVRVQINDAVNIGDEAYLLSLKLGLLPERIEALCLKANIGHLGEPDKYDSFIPEAEDLLNKLKDDPSPQLRLKVFYIKNFGLTYHEDYDTALDMGLRGLDLAKKIDSKLHVALFLYAISRIHSMRAENDRALEYIKKSIELTDELGLNERIAQNLLTTAMVYNNKRDLDTAVEFCERSLKIPEISNITKISVITLLGAIYNTKGELELALDNFKEALQLSEEISSSSLVVASLGGLGEIYRKRNDYEQACLYFNRNLILSHKLGFHDSYNFSIFNLFLINLDSNQVDEALNYLDELRQTKNQGQLTLRFYSIAKAMMLKTKKRARDRAEAEKILKELVALESLGLYMHTFSLIVLGDFLLEELSESNDPEIIGELTPLIQHLLEEAENQSAISYLAEGKLLQAKLKLITLDFDQAKLLLSQAQQIAEEHGLTLLARKISNEHDIFLEKAEEWNKLKREDATMADRIELASFDGVIDRLQGKKAVNPPELVNEEPILLLIMDNSGATYFNHPFVANWDYSDLFSSFMSAFNTFMDEIFSNSIDRIKIKENTILINPVDPFLACYVIKGQSYPALQKLTRFTETIRENSEIWQALNNSVKTSEMLDLDNSSALKTIITEIFF